MEQSADRESTSMFSRLKSVIRRILDLLQRCLLLFLIERLYLITWSGIWPIALLLPSAGYFPDWFLCYADAINQYVCLWILLNLCVWFALGWRCIFALHHSRRGLPLLTCVLLGLYAAHLRSLAASWYPSAAATGESQAQLNDIQNSTDQDFGGENASSFTPEPFSLFDNGWALLQKYLVTLPILKLFAGSLYSMMSLKLLRLGVEVTICAIIINTFPRLLKSFAIPAVIFSLIFSFGSETISWILSWFFGYIFQLIMSTLLCSFISGLLCFCCLYKMSWASSIKNEIWRDFFVGHCILSLLFVALAIHISLPDFFTRFMQTSFVVGTIVMQFGCIGFSEFNDGQEHDQKYYAACVGNYLRTTVAQHWRYGHTSNLVLLNYFFMKIAILIYYALENFEKDVNVEGLYVYLNLIQPVLNNFFESFIALNALALIFTQSSTYFCKLVGHFLQNNSWTAHVNPTGTFRFSMLLFFTFDLTYGSSDSKLLGIECCFWTLFQQTLSRGLSIAFTSTRSLMFHENWQKHTKVLSVLVLISFSLMNTSYLVAYRYPLSGWAVIWISNGIAGMLTCLFGLFEYIVLQLDSAAAMPEHRRRYVPKMLWLRAQHMDTDSLLYVSRLLHSLCSVAYSLLGVLCLLWSAVFGQGGVLAFLNELVYSFRAVVGRLLVEWKFFVQRRMFQKCLDSMPCATVSELQDLADQCSICMSELNPQAPQGTIVAACNHVFHRPCLRKLIMTSSACPVCQQVVIQLENSSNT